MPSSPTARATDQDAGPALKLSEPRTYQLQITLRVEAPPHTSVQNVIATAPVPIDWPEQQVRLVREDKPRGTRTTDRRIPEQAGMVTFRVPEISAGDAATLVRVYELTRYQTRFVDDTEQFRVPDKVPAGLREFLSSAPGLEPDDAKVVALAESLHQPDSIPWHTVRAFHDWIAENVRYNSGEYRGAQFALETRSGDCEDMSALFVALCRTSHIPARTVWIEGHAYPEFYLETRDGAGCWIPAQVAGRAWFGEMHEYRPILQKGDRFYDPIRRRYARYVPQSARATGGRATINCERKVLDADE